MFLLLAPLLLLPYLVFLLSTCSFPIYFFLAFVSCFLIYYLTFYYYYYSCFPILTSLLSYSSLLSDSYFLILFSFLLPYVLPHHYSFLFLFAYFYTSFPRSSFHLPTSSPTFLLPTCIFLLPMLTFPLLVPSLPPFSCCLHLFCSTGDLLSD